MRGSAARTVTRFARLLTVAGAASFAPAHAEPYPARPIHVIVSTSAGGVTDLCARIFGAFVTARSGQTVVIDNKSGAGGNIAMDAVAKAAPDGYTLGVANTGNIVINPFLYRHMSYDPLTDLVPVGSLGQVPLFLVVNGKVPARTLQEFVAYAKREPGKLSYASAGVGSTVHLAGEFFKRSAGVEIVHVPYKGTGPATSDLVGGQVQMMFGPAVNTLPLAQAGNLRALAVTSAKRSALAPDLPTVAESGLPGFDVVGWYGLAAPAGTPKTALAKLNGAANSVLKSADLIEQFRLQGYEPTGGTPEEATAWIKSEVTRWTNVIREAGIEPL